MRPIPYNRPETLFSYEKIDVLYSETDKMNNRLLNNKGLSDTEKRELQNAISVRNAEIKKTH